MEFHVLTPAGPELLMYVVDDQLVIVPAPWASPPAAAPAPQAPGK
jgi:hypothetical protein